MRWIKVSAACALIITALIQASAAQSIVTELYECSHVSSDLARKLKVAAVEYHCVDTVNAVPTYVTGVSAMMLYFEGPIMPAGSGYSAHVNWFGPSASEDGESPVPQTGAAHLVYDSAFSMAEWAAWNVGQSEQFDSLQGWNATGCVSVQATATEIAAKCLRSESSAYDNQQLKSGIDMTSWTWVSGSGVGGELEVCTQGLSLISSFAVDQEWPAACSAIFGSPNVTNRCDIAGGTYAHVGALWRNAVPFEGQLSFGFHGIWESVSGPLEGLLGPMLAVVTVEGGTPKLRGYSCVTDIESGEGLNCWSEELGLNPAVAAGEKACDASKALPVREMLPARCEGTPTFEEPEVYLGVENASTTMWVCSGERAVAGNVTEAAREVHCIDRDAAGRAVFVRGAWGRRGYFEGPVAGDTARLSWYAVEHSRGQRRPTSGAGVLVYDMGQGAAAGWAWGGAGAGQAAWTASGCVEYAAPTWEALAEECLWSPQPGMRERMTELGAGVLDGTVWGEEGAEREKETLRFCHDDRNTLVPYKNATWEHAVRFRGAAAAGFVGVFEGAGPLEEEAMLVAVTYGGEVPVLRGWRCEWRQGPYEHEAHWRCDPVAIPLAEAEAGCREVVRGQCGLRLSWEALKQYRHNDTMHTGGLGDLSRSMGVGAWAPRGRHYGVWACVRDWDKTAQVRCGGGPGQFVCFQYEDVEGRFEFWGLNKQVRMVPPYK